MKLDTDISFVHFKKEMERINQIEKDARHQIEEHTKHKSELKFRLQWIKQHDAAVKIQRLY